MSFYDVVKKENIVAVRLRNYVKEKIEGVCLGNFTHIYICNYAIISVIFFLSFLMYLLYQSSFRYTPHYKAKFATFVYFEMTSIKIQKVKFGIFFYI